MSSSASSPSRNHSSHQKVCSVCKGQVFKSSKPNEGYYKVKVGNEVKETQIDLNGVPYHKLCAKCSVCQVLITPSSLGKIYVKSKDKPFMLCKEHVNDTTHSAVTAPVIIDPNDPLYSTSDPSSNSNPLDIECKHLYLEWTLDFTAKKIIGTTTHVVSVRNEKGAASVNFDISALMINQVYLNGAVAEYAITDAGPNSIASVKIPTSLQSVKSEMKISFVYSTSPEATAVQWLEAIATKDGNFPYVFTQSQAIHARSMFPCFDAPGVKVPYSAAVTAPAWCTVLMSALACTHNPVPESITQLSSSSVSTTTATGSVTADTAVFYWQQPVPVSAYLVALAAGKLSSVDISPRVRVWAEPSVVASAAWEFQQTEQFLTAAESLTACAYQWTRYDVLCLPPSFPYGGMENPCLTFATPTLLAGDRSLANIIAHEIAHSWTGNLVTNATWSHFWLNEGWTVWLERKIMALVTNSNDTLKLSAQGGWKHLKDDIELIDECFTSLVWPLATNADPDDAFSSVPYEKGYSLLRYLESIVGEAEFLVFVHAYIQQFKYITVTSGQFRDFFMQHFTSAHHIISGHSSINSREQLHALDWSVLLLSQGSPTHPIEDMSNSLSLAAQSLVKQVLMIDSAAAAGTGNDADITNDGLVDIKGWSTEQTTLFLDTLLESQSSTTTQQQPQKQPILQEKTLQLLDKRFKFTDSNNAEIKFRWQLLCLRCHNTQWIFPHVVAFITNQGRMKYVRPLYRALRDCDCGSDDEGVRLAAHTFATNQQTYHPVARKMVAKDLQAALEKYHLSSSSQSSSSASDDPSIRIPSPTPAPPAAAPVGLKAENQLNIALETFSPPETTPNATAADTAAVSKMSTPSAPVTVSAEIAPTPTPTEIVTAALSRMDDISAAAVMTQKEATSTTATASSTTSPNDNDQINRKAVSAVAKERSNISRWIVGGVLTVAVAAAAVTAFVILKHRK